MKYVANPRAFTLKTWLTQMLQQKFEPHESIVERVAPSLTTDSDLKSFSALMGEIFQAGYMRAVNDYRVQLEKHGMKINVVNHQ